ncbi:unnamed protein product [Protopolystoma xenopodis]|uniref:Uncharacterized protein n=1 Tax=Protopolystoma xenopodis TaxID=117903 RepID=A0A448X582_9PLAT|nr:unnamed protein product [Protopolystoma xenopodis]
MTFQNEFPGLTLSQLCVSERSIYVESGLIASLLGSNCSTPSRFPGSSHLLHAPSNLTDISYRGICLPTVAFCCLTFYVEVAFRLLDPNAIPTSINICRPFASNW